MRNADRNKIQGPFDVLTGLMYYIYDMVGWRKGLAQSRRPLITMCHMLSYAGFYGGSG